VPYDRLAGLSDKDDFQMDLPEEMPFWHK
jgi:hypothetical protein